MRDSNVILMQLCYLVFVFGWLAVGFGGCASGEIEGDDDNSSDSDSDSDTDSDTDTDTDTDTDSDTDTDTDVDTDFDTGPFDVVLLSPDYTSTTQDFTFIDNVVATYANGTIEWWNTNLGTPTLADLQAYDVVVIGNNTPWNQSPAPAVEVGNVLADYVDAGGRVVDTNFVHDYYYDAVNDVTWYLEGRYVDEGYGPFSQSSAESPGPNTLEVVDGTHPVMAGVSSLSENVLIVNCGLQTGATLLATWSCGYNAIAVSADQQVVGINMMVFGGAGNTGDGTALLHNAITWVGGN
jgi:hypothetical protein